MTDTVFTAMPAAHDARWLKLPAPASILAWITLMAITALCWAYSPYWALLAPSWLTFAAFLSGAPDAEDHENGASGHSRLAAGAR